EVTEFLRRYRSAAPLPVDLALRALFNPNIERVWFASITSLMAQITILSVVLTGAALVREREHGTVEHLLVMPVAPAEIMVSKIWSMGLVVWVAVFLSLMVVVQGVLQVPIKGSVPLSCSPPHCSSTPRPRWGSLWPPWPNPCRSLRCFSFSRCSSCSSCPAPRRRGKACRRSFRTSCLPRPTLGSSCWRRRSCFAAPAS